MRKSPASSLGIASAILVTGAFLAWGGWIAVWHLRIRRAVTWCERNAKDTGAIDMPDFDIPAEMNLFFKSAGCRAVPYLSDALDDSTNPEFRAWAMRELGRHAYEAISRESPGGVTPPELVALMWNYDESAAEHLRKLRHWERDHALTRHAWWKPWSANCLTD